MKTNEFIFPIKLIFDGEDSVLTQYDTKQFYIGPYQRGYKWNSDTRYDQVPQMLLDIYIAWKEQSQEYFLQYITVLIRHDLSALEVIDGQQRITTLSIFFYVLENFIKNANLAQGKVQYARYKSDIFRETIHDFNSGKKANEDSQDKDYLLRATSCIYRFLDTLNSSAELEKYIEFLKNNVKLIVNIESEFVKPEEVFSNLNDNKVPLTNNYLIKALLLTKGVETTDEHKKTLPYREVMSQRSMMGRLWDEMQSWIEQPQISYFFFGREGNGMEGLLSLVSPRQSGYSYSQLSGFFKGFNNVGAPIRNDLQLFYQFDEAIKTKEKAQKTMRNLRQAYLSLKDVYNNYEDCDLYNQLGYMLFAKKWKNQNDRISYLKGWIYMDKDDQKRKLHADILAILPDMSTTDIKEFKYKSDNPKLTKLLLSFSVFPEAYNPAFRFDFYQYDRQKWTFEHIFPQHPPKKSFKLHSSAKPVVMQKIENNNQISANIKEMLVQKIKDGNFLEPDDIDFLYDSDIVDVDACGNMALLGGGPNAALGNHPYCAKRPILMSKVKEGVFVPQHTLSVYNKILTNSDMEYDLSVWTEKDVEAHEKWMKKRNKEIISMFK